MMIMMHDICDSNFAQTQFGHANQARLISMQCEAILMQMCVCAWHTHTFVCMHTPHTCHITCTCDVWACGCTWHVHLARAASKKHCPDLTRQNKQKHVFGPKIETSWI